MAWSKKETGAIIELYSGAGDFVWATNFPENPEGVKLESVQVVFNAANDKVVIRDGSVTGPIIFEFTTLDGSSVAKHLYGRLYKPCIESDDLTGIYANWHIIFVKA